MKLLSCSGPHINITDCYCRYRDFRNPPWSEHKYEYSESHWHVLAARFAFVVCFEVIIFLFLFKSASYIS